MTVGAIVDVVEAASTTVGVIVYQRCRVCERCQVVPSYILLAPSSTSPRGWSSGIAGQVTGSILMSLIASCAFFLLKLLRAHVQNASFFLILSVL